MTEPISAEQNKIIDQSAPPVSFLGICERSTTISRGHPLATQHNILGLERFVFSRVFPMSLNNFQFVFSVYNPKDCIPFSIKLIAPSGEETLKLDVSTCALDDSNQYNGSQARIIPVHEKQQDWVTIVAPIDDINVIVKEPGHYNVVLHKDGRDIIIGYLLLHYVKVSPLTDSQIAAIRSNPRAAKKINIKIECNACRDSIIGYVGLEGKGNDSHDGAIWYSELPDFFECKCGKAKYDLKYMRENLHALLGQTQEKHITSSFTKLYEEGALENISREFGDLLRRNPKEEDIQKYIERNPILLQYFAPEKILYKSPILTQYYTDISIYTHNKELILIELEKPNTRLLKKNGVITANLQHALDQVSNWLFLIDQHRAAVLECLDLKGCDVTKIRGVVIAGRDAPYRKKYLNKLRWKNFGNIFFYTYDDLQSILVNLIRNLKNL